MSKLLKIFSAVVFGLCITGLIVFGVLASVYSKEFYKASLVDIISLISTIILSGLLVFTIFIFGEKSENIRRRKEIVHELINNIKEDFEYKLDKPNSDNLKDFWVSGLIVKKNAEYIINCLLKNKSCSELNNDLSELSIFINNYFCFFEENFYGDSKPELSQFNQEKKLRRDVINKLIDCILKIY